MSARPLPCRPALAARAPRPAPRLPGAARRLAARLLPALLLGAGAAAAQEGGGELVRLVNDYRAEPQRCEGRRTEAVGPLAPAAALAEVRIPPGGGLQGALKERGYLAARAQIVTLSGPADAQAAMALLREHYCRVLASPDFAEIGVSREGRSWRIVLARPLLAPDLGDWREAGRAVLEQANAARAQARRCGRERFEAAPPLAWSDALAQAARAHSEDMARRGYFAHRSPEGGEVGERATRQGYRWGRIGENIATGQGSPEQVVAGWLESPGHCRNLMDPNHTEMGAAYAVNPQRETTIYWTQVLGAPR